MRDPERDPAIAVFVILSVAVLLVAIGMRIEQWFR